ncbi:PAR6 [Oopsacas minuta]
MSILLENYNPDLCSVFTNPQYNPDAVEVKAKFEMQFRRFNIFRGEFNQIEDFYTVIREQFGLTLDMAFHISYTDPIHQDLLPINNNDNLAKAFTTANPLIKLYLYRREDLMWEDIAKRKRGTKLPIISIGMPQDFRQVSTILYQEGQPPQVLRVKLIKHSPDQKLGFYVRDGKSVRMTTNGIERVDSFFISRLVAGGLAEGTGLLSVEDEILEVNGIEVAGKTLDQVTDIMVANSKNLILTIQPASAPKMAPNLKQSDKFASISSSFQPPNHTTGEIPNSRRIGVTPSRSSVHNSPSSVASQDLSVSLPNSNFHNEVIQVEPPLISSDNLNEACDNYLNERTKL